MEKLRVTRRSRSGRLAFCLVQCAVIAACATKTVPVAPTTPRYPDFMYPVVPDTLKHTPGAASVEYGWRYLQGDDLQNAELQFSTAVKRSPSLYPAHAGAGYVALVRKDYSNAIGRFDAALAV